MDQSETQTEITHASSTIGLSFKNTKIELVQNDQEKDQISRIFVSKSVILVSCRQLQSSWRYLRLKLGTMAQMGSTGLISRYIYGLSLV